MMKDITLNLKHIMLSFALAMLAVSASAVNVTYSLTTHVDGRTITGTANVAAGGDLLNAMPQALWRAYCTYTFTTDAGEEITTAPANGGTVYVDYEFDPPFTLSEDNGEPVWHYLKHNPGVGVRLFYYNQYKAANYHKYGTDDMFYTQANLKEGNMTLRKKENAYWAFYGDAYCLNLKFNDVNNVEANDFMVCKITGSSRPSYKLETGTKMMPGWQMYVNDDMSGSFSLGLPADQHINQFVWMYDLGDDASIKSLAAENASRSAQNHIIGNNAKTYAFMAVPANGNYSSTDPWHVTYKIQMFDGKWYDDIVVQKNSNNLTPSFPPAGFNPNPDYEYDYFYLDANFKEKCADNYTMPAEGNTILYIKEIAEEENYISTPWMTLVLPYTIKDVDDYFGEGAVLVNEYTSVDGKLSSDDKDAYFRCNLNFTETKTIEANKPYMFRAINVKESLYEGMYDVANMEIGEPIEVKWYDDVNAPNVGVSMIGTFEPNGYNMEDDKLHFFFSSKQDETGAYTYSYVRRGAIIPCFRCYFYVTDERPGATSALHISAINSGSLTAISDVMAENAHVVAPIYSLDGRQMGASIDNLKKGVYIINGRKVVK